MYFKQFYLGCLAHASYLIGSEGEAAVVDPRRDVDEYVTEARAQGLRIRYVIETHLHADFVSGHRELAERTGAEVVFGARAGAAFPHRAVQEGDEVRLGRVVLRFLETPGHTPEAMAGLLYDSLHRKLLTLPDDVLVYPAHGAGSLCGRNISADTWSTIGEQRRANYALQPMARTAFIEMMTADLPELPPYFAMDV
ncbi:MAG TPA: MBL fold metallo-hydrolase, partial [Acidimicrobiia bacterium]|nr:MBL fold metallo-hydrolase [Acidimicrobiia bacterium]